MPRVADIYQRPAGIDAITNQTIESGDYNTNVADVEFDLNYPRPIVAGGTGANSAAAARTSLGVSVAMQTVTNYDTHVFENGGFNSAPGATNAPTAGAFYYGTAVASGPNTVEIEAANLSDGLTPHTLYRRSKNGGVWGAWAIAQSNQFLSKTANDTTVGNITISKVSPLLVLGMTAPSQTAGIVVYSGANKRWDFYLGNADAESTGNVGSNAVLNRYSDAGALLGGGNLLKIDRATGALTYNAAVNVNGALSVYGYAGDPLKGAIYFNNPASKYLWWDGAVFNLNGPLTVTGNTSITGNISATGTVTSTGAMQAGTSLAGQTLFVFGAGTDARLYFYHNGSATQKGALLFDGGDTFYLTHNAAGHQLGIFSNGMAYTTRGYVCKAGSAGAATPNNAFNLQYTGAVRVWIDTTDMGSISFVSDYRTKKDIIDLPSTWAAVKALRPISYSQAEFNPPSSTSTEPLFQEDDTERWGFLAHQLQDTLIPHAATGVKDDPVCVQSPNPWVVIAALTKALQEAMTRIEALEAKHA